MATGPSGGRKKDGKRLLYESVTSAVKQDLGDGKSSTDFETLYTAFQGKYAPTTSINAI